MNLLKFSHRPIKNTITNKSFIIVVDHPPYNTRLSTNLNSRLLVAKRKIYTEIPPIVVSHLGMFLNCSTFVYQKSPSLLDSNSRVLLQRRTLKILKTIIQLSFIFYIHFQNLFLSSMLTCEYDNLKLPKTHRQ